jgi:hypothetical protein
LLRDFWDTEADTDPSKMDLIQFLVVLAVAFGICKLEWENFQFRIRKIGPVELDQIISTQADERERDISELRKRVQALERAQSGRVLEAQSLSSPEPEELKGLLERFLSNYAAWSFSPTRISTWGSSKRTSKN